MKKILIITASSAALAGLAAAAAVMVTKKLEAVTAEAERAEESAYASAAQDRAQGGEG